MRARMTRNKAVFKGILFLLPIVTLITLGPFLLPDPLAIDVRAALQKPSFDHFLGTDVLGRDMLSRLCYAGRYSLFVAFVALTGSLIIGLAASFLAGWFGGIVDTVLDRLLEMFTCIPSIMLALLLVLFFGRGSTGIVIALGITGAVYIARLARVEIQLLKKSGFVEAALLYGVPGYRIFLFHIIPNISGPILAYAAVLLGSNILGESALSFLGLGIQPPAPSLGAMLFESRNFLTSYPWLALAPGLTIFVTVLGFNLLAQGVEECLNSTAEREKAAGGNEYARKIVRG